MWVASVPMWFFAAFMLFCAGGFFKAGFDLQEDGLGTLVAIAATCVCLGLSAVSGVFAVLIWRL